MGIFALTLKGQGVHTVHLLEITLREYMNKFQRMQGNSILIFSSAQGAQSYSDR